MQMRWGSHLSSVIPNPSVEHERKTYFVWKEWAEGSCESKVVGQIRFETSNGKESFSRPEKKIEVSIEKLVLRGYGSGMSALLTQ